MHTVRLVSPLTYDFRRLTFHSITDIQIRDIIYIDRSLMVSYSYIVHILIVHVALCPYSLIFRVPLVALSLYCLTPFRAYGYPIGWPLRIHGCPHIIALEDLWIPPSNSP